MTNESLVSISHSNVIHRDNFVKDFSGVTMPRILKFCINVGMTSCIV